MHDNFADKRLANIAMDLEINQYIDPQYLPEGGCTIDSDAFKQYNLPAKAGCREYYDILSKEKEKQEQEGGGSKSKLQKILDAMAKGDSHDEDGDPVPDHSTWQDFEDMPEAEKKLMEKQLEHMLKEVAQQVKGRGTVPGEMQGLLDKINSKEPPKFDWRGYLRRFAGGSQKVYTKKLRRKYNKRFEEMAGLKIKPRKHILVAIDTSGSVSDDELREFFHEIDHINKTGADITVLQCDTKINSVKKYSAGDTVEIFGRGGTEFDPVIEYYNEHVRNYSCMVYLTDGECYCNVKPRGKMLWVISSRSQINEDLPGPKIKLN